MLMILGCILNGNQQLYSMLIGERECTKCHDILPFSEFHKSKNGKYGISCVCKLCTSKIKKKIYAENPELVRSYSIPAPYTNEYYLKHRAKFRETQKRYYARNREVLLQKCKDKYQEKKNSQQ